VSSLRVGAQRAHRPARQTAARGPRKMRTTQLGNGRKIMSYPAAYWTTEGRYLTAECTMLNHFSKQRVGVKFGGDLKMKERKERKRLHSFSISC